MESLTLSPIKSHGFSGQSGHKTISDNTPNTFKIKQGMSSNEIAEVVSDHLISVVKQQFEVAKERYREQSNDTHIIK